MSDASEKAFAATPSRIAKAKREGNVARAQEFGATIAFGVAAATVVGVAPAIALCAQHALVLAARRTSAFADLLALIAWSLTPMAAACIAGTVAAAIQSGGLLVVAVTIKGERLNPFPGLARMFSGEAIAHGTRAAAAAVLAGVAVAATLRDLLNAASTVPDYRGVAALAWSAAQRVTGAIVALGLLFALLEFGVARRTWLQKLRMTFEEYRREMKEHDGDPATRSRRSSLHRDVIRGSIARVKDAAFVLVNPTHVAVALEYRPPDVPVPTVLVRAADEMALRVREEAAVHRVPIVENASLARALYRDAGLGLPIAIEHYVAVAEVVCALARRGESV